LLAFAENSVQLVPDGTLFLHIAIIAIMVFVLSRTLFRPINRVLEERDLTTKGRLSEAEAIARRARQTVEQYEERLREARTHGYQQMEQQRASALRKREEQILGLKAEITGWLNEQKAELRNQAENARRMLATESRVLGVKIASRILGRPIKEVSGS
jgi:F-type H+-transporting ATPase subunit b